MIDGSTYEFSLNMKETPLKRFSLLQNPVFWKKVLLQRASSQKRKFYKILLPLVPFFFLTNINFSLRFCQAFSDFSSNNFFLGNKSFDLGAAFFSSKTSKSKEKVFL